MSEKSIKFKVLCYLQGYGGWNIEVYDGSCSLKSDTYTVLVKSGKHGGNDISDKIFSLSSHKTIIEENRI